MQDKINAKEIVERMEQLLDNEISGYWEVKEKWQAAAVALPVAVIKEIAEAQERVCLLCKELPEGIGDTLLDYDTYLEMAATRLAHYYGYLFGNEALPYIEPGYGADLLLTGQYQRTMQEWYGI